MKNLGFSLFAIALLTGLTIAACSSDDNSSDKADSTTTTAAKSEIHEVSVEAKEYSFGLPKEVPSGTVEFTFEPTYQCSTGVYVARATATGTGSSGGNGRDSGGRGIGIRS